jgi:hypothetical protein
LFSSQLEHLTWAKSFGALVKVRRDTLFARLC